jgi:hypothetical protein
MSGVPVLPRQITRSDLVSAMGENWVSRLEMDALNLAMRGQHLEPNQYAYSPGGKFAVHINYHTTIYTYYQFRGRPRRPRGR